VPQPLWLQYAPLIVVGVALLAHALCVNSIFYQDDYPQMLNNSRLRQGHWYLWPRRALVILSYYLTYWACGLEFRPIPFHVFNLLLHSGTSLIAFFVVREFFTHVETKTLRVNAEWGAFAAATLFACHPLTTEVTNYVRGRDMGMVTLLALLAVWFAG